MATYIIAPEGSDGARATYDMHLPSDMFHGIEPWNNQLSTPTQLIFKTLAGNRLVLNGTGFIFDKNASNPWIAGTINSVELQNNAGSIQYATLTGLMVDLNQFGSRPWTEGRLDLLLKGNDTIQGGQGGDHLRGMFGDDLISGGMGDDYINPGSGSDTIDGGEGFNGIDYGEYESAEKAEGIYIDLGSISKSFKDPWGFVDTFSNIQQVTGTIYDDTLVGDNEFNWFGGSAGNDHIFGMGGDDVITGGDGNDTINGGEGFDTATYEYENNGNKGIIANLQAGTVTDSWNSTDTVSGIERLRSTNYADSVTGSTSDDIFQTLGDADTVFGGDGVDTVDYSRDSRWGGNSGVTVNLATNSAKDGFGANDSISGIENAVGTQFADTITGNSSANLLIGKAGTDILSGGTGDDSLEGGEDGDVLRGGAGNDTAVFSESKGNYTFAVGAGGALVVSGTETDLVYEVELFRFKDGTFTVSQLTPNTQSPPPPVVVTSEPPVVTPPVTAETATSTTLAAGVINLIAVGISNISLTGNALDNSITGNMGKNTVDGGAGADKVNGGLGIDNLTGGSGKDAFVFSTKLGTSKTDRTVNFDMIKDFSVKDDSIYLDNGIFKKLGKKGSETKPVKVDKKFFTVGDKAKDKDDYIVYNKKTGVLSYDADGLGKAQAVEFALLKNKPTLKVDDFFVI